MSFPPDEQEKLDAIQTQVAAFYEYGVDDYKRCPGGGKMTVSTVHKKRIRLGSKYNWKTSSSSSKDQDFKVLSLEEIRRKKQASAEASKSSENKSEQNSFQDGLEDAIKTVEVLRKEIVKEKSFGKRCFSEVEDLEEEREVKIQKVEKMEGIKVPPVKLRRFNKSGENNLGRSTNEVCQIVEENEILNEIDALLTSNVL